MPALTLAPAVIGSILSTSGTSPKSITGISGTSAGSVYVACFARTTASDKITGVTDNGGNTWTKIASGPDTGTTGRQVAQWSTLATSTFTSITVTYDGTGNIFGTLLETYGLNGDIDAFDGGGRANSTAPAPYSITPSVDNTLALAICGYTPNTQAQVTLDSPWIRLSGGHASGPNIAYILNPSVGASIGAAWHGSASQGSGHAVANYKSAAPPPPTGRIVRLGATVQKIGIGSGSTRTKYQVR